MPLRASTAFASLLPLALACAPSKAPVPPPTNVEPTTDAEPTAAPSVQAPAAETEACAKHKAALREEYCDPEAPEEPCETDTLACELSCDLDGDGHHERVAIELVEGEPTLGVSWSDGRHELVASPAQPLVERESGDSFTSLSWLMSWEVLRRDGKGFFIDIAGKPRKLPIGDTDGDVLLVSGGDAAAALFRREGAFVLEQLGF